MKSKDLAILIVVGLFAALIGFGLSTVLVKSPPLSRSIDKMTPIDKNFPNAHKGKYNEVFPAKTIDTFSEIHANETDENDN